MAYMVAGIQQRGGGEVCLKSSALLSPNEWPLNRNLFLVVETRVCIRNGPKYTINAHCGRGGILTFNRNTKKRIGTSQVSTWNQKRVFWIILKSCNRFLSTADDTQKIPFFIIIKGGRVFCWLEMSKERRCRMTSIHIRTGGRLYLSLNKC